MNTPSTFAALRRPAFRWLFAAHTVSLLGDAFTWLGLALVAYELAGAGSAEILGIALTLRVVSYVAIAPMAGALADRIERRRIMIAADLARAGVVAGLYLAHEVWHVYALMLVLNAFTALFRPAFEASIPETAGDETQSAIGLSSATTEIFGVLGPGIAGGIAALVGSRQLFAVDAISFALSALLLTRIRLRALEPATEKKRWLDDVLVGTRRLWSLPPVRYALGLELVAAVSGAVVLVNTVELVRGVLGHGESEYGWVMMGFGLGATLGALAFARLRNRRVVAMTIGAALSAIALLPAPAGGWIAIAALWAVAGFGQNWVNIGVQGMIAEHYESDVLGRVYGAHFAWSHLWWVGAYPLAAWLGSMFAEEVFRIGGAIALGVLLILVLLHVRSRTVEQ